MGVTGLPIRKSAVEPAGLELQSNTSEQQHLDKAELDRTAVLIASGEESFPTWSSPEVQNYLAEAVRELRRQELLCFIARQIAIAIHCSHDTDERRTKHHDQINLFV